MASGAADRCEVQVAYAIGVAHPLSIMVETFGTENVENAKIVAAVTDVFDLRPGAITGPDGLDLRKPIFKRTSSYGHFGRTATEDGGFSWEKLNKVDDLKSALGL